MIDTDGLLPVTVVLVFTLQKKWGAFIIVKGSWFKELGLPFLKSNLISVSPIPQVLYEPSGFRASPWIIFVLNCAPSPICMY